ncbi:MAG: hypothetical protein QOC95_1869 [Thermoleophilaceae bacterium]|nr:hypothetical protein [Thermoleophilaceae bacterium]
MTGDCHVRFCERRRVRSPPATHLHNANLAPFRSFASAVSPALRASFQISRRISSTGGSRTGGYGGGHAGWRVLT